MSDAQFLPTSRPRAGSVDLEWPVIVDGVEYRTITLRRLTAGEVERAVREAWKGPADAPFRLPVFLGPDGKALPASVLDALDDDDMLLLDEASADFFPRRFRVATAAGSTQEQLPSIAPSSAAGSAGA